MSRQHYLLSDDWDHLTSERDCLCCPQLMILRKMMLDLVVDDEVTDMVATTGQNQLYWM